MARQGIITGNRGENVEPRQSAQNLEEHLKKMQQAENFLHDLGWRVLRVRHHGDTARIEVPLPDFEAILTHRQEIRQKFHALGFVYTALDLDGFKSGYLNSVLKST